MSGAREADGLEACAFSASTDVWSGPVVTLATAQRILAARVASAAAENAALKARLDEVRALAVPIILPPLCLGWLHERREKGCE